MAVVSAHFCSGIKSFWIRFKDQPKGLTNIQGFKMKYHLFV